MPYLNVDLAYFTHRKTIRLVGLLGRGAEVLPIKLWSHCGVHHAESGKLTSYGPEEIEAVAGWWGEKGRAVEAMLTVGFLDHDKEGNLQVHDWFDHAGHLAAFKKRARTAAKARWRLYATSNALSNAKSKTKQCPSRGKAQLGKVPKDLNSEGRGEAFEAFYAAYPKKVAKPQALKAWNKQAATVGPDVIMAALDKHKHQEQWQKENGKFIPHPATWLNQHRWNDELAKPGDSGTAGMERDAEGYLLTPLEKLRLRKGGKL